MFSSRHCIQTPAAINNLNRSAFTICGAYVRTLVSFSCIRIPMYACFRSGTLSHTVSYTSTFCVFFRLFHTKCKWIFGKVSALLKFNFVFGNLQIYGEKRAIAAMYSTASLEAIVVCRLDKVCEPIYNKAFFYFDLSVCTLYFHLFVMYK